MKRRPDDSLRSIIVAHSRRSCARLSLFINDDDGDGDGDDDVLLLLFVELFMVDAADVM